MRLTFALEIPEGLIETLEVCLCTRFAVEILDFQCRFFSVKHPTLLPTSNILKENFRQQWIEQSFHTFWRRTTTICTPSIRCLSNSANTSLEKHSPMDNVQSYFSFTDLWYIIYSFQKQCHFPDEVLCRYRLHFLSSVVHEDTISIEHKEWFDIVEQIDRRMIGNKILQIAFHRSSPFLKQTFYHPDVESTYPVIPKISTETPQVLDRISDQIFVHLVWYIEEKIVPKFLNNLIENWNRLMNFYFRSKKIDQIDHLRSK